MSDALAAIIGDNNPPPDLLTGDALREKLRDENRDLLKRRDDLLGAAERLPVIADDDTAGKVTDFVKQLTALGKAAEAKRTSEKEPYLEGGRHIDGFFKGITDPVAEAKKAAERRLTDYLMEKEANARRQREEQGWVSCGNAEIDYSAREPDPYRTRGEYGSVSSLRTQWTFDGIDRASLDLEALRMHFSIDAFERAIRSFIRFGGRELRGTQIIETNSAVVR